MDRRQETVHVRRQGFECHFDLLPQQEASYASELVAYPEFIDGYGVLVLPRTGPYMHVPYGAMLPKRVKSLLERHGVRYR